MALRFYGVKAFLIIGQRNLFKIVCIKDVSKGKSCRRIQGKLNNQASEKTTKPQKGLEPKQFQGLQQ